jgi:hypothetical protein
MAHSSLWGFTAAWHACRPLRSSALPAAVHCAASPVLLCLRRFTLDCAALLCGMCCAVLQATSSLLGRLVEASSSSSEPRCDCWAACRDALAAVACWQLLLALIHDRMRCLGTGHIICGCPCCSGRTDRSSQTETRLATITGTVPQRGFRLPVRCWVLWGGGEGAAGCSSARSQVVLSSYQPA